jgi:hypothetical protein
MFHNLFHVCRIALVSAGSLENCILLASQNFCHYRTCLACEYIKVERYQIKVWKYFRSTYLWYTAGKLQLLEFDENHHRDR